VLCMIGLSEEGESPCLLDILDRSMGGWTSGPLAPNTSRDGGGKT